MIAGFLGKTFVDDEPISDAAQSGHPLHVAVNATFSRSASDGSVGFAALQMLPQEGDKPQQSLSKTNLLFALDVLLFPGVEVVRLREPICDHVKKLENPGVCLFPRNMRPGTP